MKVYLVIAEHHAVPGRRIYVCKTRRRAAKEAIACTNVILNDLGIKPVITEIDMEVVLCFLQDNKKLDCFVEITEHELLLD
ncbi:hypothetical protein [Bradyrhizobium manausense]|uniref:Uncharacterized protein n=1 Tax=Bradyrhizobium manausense TaxID=989370 RepID=A0A0R3DCA7_9BRAD|nr:hypothetical protein [Bradyrhizobium manausense]KRQ07507.1 hypothetical protein AOQ71_23325 [Bradyrhizobium manausense]